mmetsp:Transcript_21262/g.23666  ORF Transcript_21262/g.23666 Transcript_21262/m.23666 type:complete len:189 (+) Transcript_21262:54-620(+)|eukprot:CAMPEP_0205826212 /NCGR_PEP_ID=MMETSP0206-20130828/27962_1 /ASSEMBLY_ACC=CAM_ASM_000279 /TAXON_ID=36767 /ORGANISM="Euplotes focardii, Strain TN1" /LENGTH=188 /DNA_ID=CAMNT_0053125961 /DNA_START=55 /DNA_END=621 /DNA_ORIENTATION=+
MYTLKIKSAGVHHGGNIRGTTRDSDIDKPRAFVTPVTPSSLGAPLTDLRMSTGTLRQCVAPALSHVHMGMKVEGVDTPVEAPLAQPATPQAQPRKHNRKKKKKKAAKQATAPGVPVARPVDATANPAPKAVCSSTPSSMRDLLLASNKKLIADLARLGPSPNEADLQCLAEHQAEALLRQLRRIADRA